MSSATIGRNIVKKLSFDVKIAKIGPADPEIICLREIIKNIKKEKKKEITEGKIYIPFGKFAERAKQCHARHSNEGNTALEAVTLKELSRHST